VKKTFLAMATLLLLGCMGAQAQSLAVTRENRTIYVSAEESVSVDPQVAIVKVGYLNFGGSEDAAFDESARVGNAVLKALTASGVPEKSIETKSVTLSRTPFDARDPEVLRKERAFKSEQVWTIRVPVAEAQGVINAAVGAGANEVMGVEWTVEDPYALEARARGAALVKARRDAEQIAKGMGARLGVLIYASNAFPIQEQGYGAGAGGGLGGGVFREGEGIPAKPALRVFPQKVERGATVYAVFAIE
jgi:uncharacterized protein